MEAHKAAYTHQLFERTVGENSMHKKTTEIIAKDCAKEVLHHETSARAYYAQGSVTYGNFEFAEMMVIDGCFILELLYRFSHPGSILFDNQTLQEVKSDLLLLENQIPFPILEVLFSLTLKKMITPCLPLIDLILLFFKDMDILHDVQRRPGDEEVKHCHILGFLQSCYKPTKDISWGEIPTISFSATEIAGAGVIFKPNKDKGPLLAVKFEESPLFQGLATPDMVKDASFKIPVLCINYFTVTFLKNLIAYEQCCCPSTDRYVTSFAFLMDKLIETKDDVSLLVRSKVLQHQLGACEEVTTIFNNICNGVVLQGFYYSSEVKGFEDYCKRSWPTLLISLRNLYRSTTWKTLTVIAAIVIFILTLIQTIIAICSV